MVNFLLMMPFGQLFTDSRPLISLSVFHTISGQHYWYLLGRKQKYGNGVITISYVISFDRVIVHALFLITDWLTGLFASRWASRRLFGIWLFSDGDDNMRPSRFTAIIAACHDISYTARIFYFYSLSCRWCAAFESAGGDQYGVILFVFRFISQHAIKCLLIDASHVLMGNFGAIELLLNACEHVSKPCDFLLGIGIHKYCYYMIAAVILHFCYRHNAVKPMWL